MYGICVGDIALTNLVKLLIIDEVHLLHGDRGPVVEAVVARTLRQVSYNIVMKNQFYLMNSIN